MVAQSFLGPVVDYHTAFSISRIHIGRRHHPNQSSVAGSLARQIHRRNAAWQPLLPLCDTGMLAGLVIERKLIEGNGVASKSWSRSYCDKVNEYKIRRQLIAESPPERITTMSKWSRKARMDMGQEARNPSV